MFQYISEFDIDLNCCTGKLENLQESDLDTSNKFRCRRCDSDKCDEFLERFAADDMFADLNLIN